MANCPEDEPASGSKYSAKFSAPDAEVTFQSSDNVFFKIHQNELSITSGGFGPPPNADFQEVVGLSEDEETLELLFQFVYPSMTPDISTISFLLLDRLCEAAHKYQVYSAMDLCSLYMNEAIAEQSIQVFRFSVRHGYMDIASRAAPLVIDEPLESIVEKIGFSPMETLRWLRYYRSWIECQKAAITTLSPQDTADYKSIVEKLCNGLRSLQNLNSVFSSSTSSESRGWQERISLAVASIPKFSDVFYNEHNGKLETEDNQPTNQDSTTLVFYKSLDDVVVSSDPRLIRAYSSKLLKAASGASSLSRPASMFETSSVLKDLLRYMSLSKNPNSLDWDFIHTHAMAEAAEKYKILPAMRVCHFHMKKHLQSYPDSVFCYGVIHNYPEIMNTAAPLALSFGPFNIALTLPSQFVLCWLSYHDCWSRIARNALNRRTLVDFEEITIKTGRGPKKEQTFRECAHCYIAFDISEILCEFAEGPQALLHLNRILDPSKACCEKRGVEIREWKEAVQRDIDAISPFSTFIPSLALSL